MRVLLADDQHLVREAIAFYLARFWPEADITQATTVADALQRLGEGETFDLLLVDYHMPGMIDLVGLARLKAAVGSAPVVFCTGFMDRPTVEEALRRGAAGILTKDMKGPALVSALKRIVDGERYVSHSLFADDLTEAACPKAEDERRRMGGLSEREYEVVGLLVEGISNRDIAERLDLAEGTVKLHLHHAFAKMSARNRTDAARIFMNSASLEA